MRKGIINSVSLVLSFGMQGLSCQQAEIAIGGFSLQFPWTECLFAMYSVYVTPNVADKFVFNI